MSCMHRPAGVALLSLCRHPRGIYPNELAGEFRSGFLGGWWNFGPFFGEALDVHLADLPLEFLGPEGSPLGASGSSGL